MLWITQETKRIDWNVKKMSKHNKVGNMSGLVKNCEIWRWTSEYICLDKDRSAKWRVINIFKLDDIRKRQMLCTAKRVLDGTEYLILQRMVEKLKDAFR